MVAQAITSRHRKLLLRHAYKDVHACMPLHLTFAGEEAFSSDISLSETFQPFVGYNYQLSQSKYYHCATRQIQRGRNEL